MTARLHLLAAPHLVAALLAALLAVTSPGAHAQAARAEVAKPLQQASEMLRSGNARGALAKVREADAVPNKTAAEQTMITKMRVAASQRAGDEATALAGMESLMASGRLSAAEQVQYAEALAFGYAQAKNNAKASQWASKAQSLGSSSAQLKQLQAYLQGQSGDYSTVAREAAASVAAAEQAGRRPDEGVLLRLADAQQRMNNTAGYAATLDKLLAHYPKQPYWASVLNRLPSKSNMASRYAVDVLRLKYATGNLTTADEYMELAQLALLANSPVEAKAVVVKGFAAGVLGTGDQAARHQRMQALVNKQDSEWRAALTRHQQAARAARDGDDAVTLGAAMAAAGQAEAGIALIEQGISKGQLRSADDAKLRLGMAQVQAGKATRAKGIQTLRGVKGEDGSSDIARLWVIWANTH